MATRIGGPKLRGRVGPVGQIVIAERRPGLLPVLPAFAEVQNVPAAQAEAQPADEFYVMTNDQDVVVRKGDIVHAQVGLNGAAPGDIDSSTGLGCVLIWRVGS